MLKVKARRVLNFYMAVKFVGVDAKGNMVNPDPFGIKGLKSKKLSYAISVTEKRNQAVYESLDETRKKYDAEDKPQEERNKEWGNFLDTTEVEISDHRVAEVDLPNDITYDQRQHLELVIAEDEPVKPEFVCENINTAPKPAEAAK
jgi:hypothetical protein